MRGIALAALVTAGLAACASGSAGTPAETSLRVSYWENGLVQGAQPERWTLRCNPAGGTLARPRVACRRLAAGGIALFVPVPPDTICTQIYGGPQVARVVGTVAGKSVWTTFSRQNGCELARWNRLSPWLLPAGGITR